MSFPRALGPGLGLLLATLLLAACDYVETTPPAPTPADFAGIAAEFIKRDLKISDPVSGQPGCDDPTLAPTAIAFQAVGLDQTKPVEIYLYAFGNGAAYERLRSTIDTCAQSFVTDPQTFESVEQSPFVLAGQGPWAPGFEAALRAGLEVAAGAGD